MSMNKFGSDPKGSDVTRVESRDELQKVVYGNKAADTEYEKKEAPSFQDLLGQREEALEDSTQESDSATDESNESEKRNEDSE